MEKFEIMEFQLGKIEVKLTEKATTAQKKQVVEKLMDDLHYCVDHMDEAEFGRVFVRNIAIAAGVVEGEYTSLGNVVVRNTQRVMIGRIKAILNGRREADPDCTNRQETLLPGSRWAYMGNCCYLRRCKHDVTVHFKCGKRGSVPTYDEVSSKLKGLIEEAEEVS